MLSTPWKLPAALFLCAAFVGSRAQAEPIWHDFSISVLRGSNYTVDYALDADDSTRTVVTMEYAAGYTWGDMFSFIDRLASEHHQELYWELQPRFALSPWFGGKENLHSMVEELFVATTLEVANFDDPDNLSASSGSFTNALIGVGMSWNAPGFRYVHSNLYKAFNDAEADDYQLTIAWARPFSIGHQAFLYDGFIDWSSGAADHRASINWTSQLKHDLGALGGKPGAVYWGIEYVYWRNKFGIANQTSGIRSNENNLNLLLKLHL